MWYRVVRDLKGREETRGLYACKDMATENNQNGHASPIEMAASCIATI